LAVQQRISRKQRGLPDRATLIWFPEKMPQRKPALPDLYALHQRHPGLYEPLSLAYADAAALCFADTHESPADLEVRHDEEICVREVAWLEPAEEARASWANQDDATRDGAYCVSLAVVEAELGLVGLERADRRTGADFYIGRPGSDLEDAQRLEVSGARTGDKRDVSSRLRQKIEQARRGKSNRPALACVIGFAAGMVALQKVADDVEP
jgi:hypothetical protein